MDSEEPRENEKADPSATAVKQAFQKIQADDRSQAVGQALESAWDGHTLDVDSAVATIESLEPEATNEN